MVRKVKSSNEFFDILDRIGNGKFVSIGYVTGANLAVPTVKKKNPLTNRMKSYPDYTVFKGNDENEIGALVKITTYNIRYLNRKDVGKKYGEYKNNANAIRQEFGIDDIGSRKSYKQASNWSPNAPEVFVGDNEELKGHSYNPQNIYGGKISSSIYAIGTDGKILNEIPKDKIIPYLKAKGEISGVSALRKMNAEEDRIQEYIKRINDLKFKYINFESNSILWIAATVNGEKIVYINDALQRTVDGIDIRPEDFRAIARERYNISLNMLGEMNRRMNVNKNLIKLTESDLHNIIKESVKSILKEMDNSQYSNNADNIGREFINFIEKYRGGSIIQDIVDFESGNQTGYPCSPLPTIIPEFEVAIGRKCTPEMRKAIKAAYNQWWYYAQNELLTDEDKENIGDMRSHTGQWRGY